MSLKRRPLKPASRRNKVVKGLAVATAVGACLGVPFALMTQAPAAQAASYTPPPRAASYAAYPDTDEQRKIDLVEANHILANEGVMDGLGHISVRSKSNPKHYFMSRSVSPGSVTLNDIMEFDEESRPIDQQGREIYGERAIHGEIYKARPDVQAVVHSHTASVLPFTVTGVPFKAVIHMAAFIGIDPAPIFEIRDSMGPDNRILVNNPKSGAALAKTLGNRNVVLMRGHGMAVVADSSPGGPARWVAQHAYYTHWNAVILAQSLLMGKPQFLNQYEAKFSAGSLPRWWEEYSAKAESNSHLNK